MAAKNEVIGEVECPAKGCALMVPVYRFRGRQNERMQRFAGKLYCRCPKHGQFGGAVGDDDMQDYIAEHAKKCDSKKSAGNDASKSAAEPAAAPEIPQKLPAAKPTAKAPVTPAAEPAAPATVKRTGFGFFS